MIKLGKIHTDGSRSGNQHTQSNLHETQIAAEQSFAKNANQSTEQERQPTQSDDPRPRTADTLSIYQKWYNSGVEEAAKALEADAKLCDCAAREERECDCGAWCEWKSITSARAVEIVRALVKGTPVS